MVCIHSVNGFVSTAWGPVLWYLLHTLSFRADTDRDNFQRWFLLLKDVLPCGACRGNFSQNLMDAGYVPTMTFRSMRSTSTFMWRLHKAVNHSLHKPNTLSYRQVKQQYYSDRIRNVTVTINGEYWNSGLDPNSGSPGCSFLHSWVFLLMIIALNFPMIPHSPRSTAFYPWLVAYIRVLPDMDLQARFEKTLLSALRPDSQTWTRSYFVDTVVQCLDVCTLTNVETCNLLEQFENLRATTCSTNTSASEGSCTRPSDIIQCRVEGNYNGNS